MAIEHAAMPESDPAESEGMDDSMGETLSMSLLGGKEVKPGDIVRIRVESVNEDDGTWQGVYAENKPQSSKLGNQLMADEEMMKGGI